WAAKPSGAAGGRVRGDVLGVRGSLEEPQHPGVPAGSPTLTCAPPPLAQLQAQKLRLAHSRGPYYSGSLPNVNQIGSGVSDFQRDPRRMMSPLRRYVRQ
uniref:Uncharacterized protein n=1 Tax=Strix occidentalis caurina TaxID=311401 RepID=A0A8D0F907_STROC